VVKHQSLEETAHTHICHNCEKRFKSKRTDAFTCSPRCRKALSRARAKMPLLTVKKGPKSHLRDI
jgi:hypothetical protein